jgi:hypothetical protein
LDSRSEENGAQTSGEGKTSVLQPSWGNGLLGGRKAGFDVPDEQPFEI